MALDYWLHVFSAVPLDVMASRLFPTGAPGARIQPHAFETTLPSGMIVRIMAPANDEFEAQTPDGEALRYAGPQTIVGMRIDDDGDFDLQRVEAETLASRLGSTGEENFALAFEDELVTSRVDRKSAA